MDNRHLIDMMHILDKLYIDTIKLKRVHDDKCSKLVEYDATVRMKKKSYYYKPDNKRSLKDFLFKLQAI